MQVALAAGTLTIRPSRLVVLADDAPGDRRLADAAGYALGVARKRGAGAVVGLLGHPALGHALPAEPGPVRGRFLTPLVENGLLEAADGATLLCLVAGPIYDWDDWAEALTGAYSTVHVVRFAPFARVHGGATEHRVERLADPAIEEVLDGVLAGKQTSDVEIVASAGVLLGVPAAFRAIATADGVTYAGRIGETTLDAPLRALCLGSTPEVSVTVRVDDRVAHHTLVTEAPDDPHPVTLGPADAEALTAALAAYGSGEREHACPLCGSSHDFPHALACERAEGVFARSARPVLSAWRAAATGRIALLPGASWAAIPLPDAAVVWLGDVAVVWGPDGAHQLLVPDGQKWRSRDLETVWPGMERDRVTGILVATCSVEGAEATR